MRRSKKTIATALATAFVAGSFDAEDLTQRGSQVMGKRLRWLQPLAQRLSVAYRGQIRPRKSTVESFILGDPGFHRAYRRYQLKVVDPLGISPLMAPTAVASGWQKIPAIITPQQLATWLEVPLRQLDWFAGAGQFARSPEKTKLQHYRYRALSKGSGQVRLIEAPKPRLKGMQQKILAEILDHVPPHTACHGFRRGRSIATFAQPHQGQAVVVKLDLQDFFPSVPVPQINAIFRYLGYPERVADLLAGLCTTTTPDTIWQEVTAYDRTCITRHQIARYARPHLPQGAPTSPALANLCAYRLDYRLSGLAIAAGASYTRYADDLAFSGGEDFRRAARRFVTHAAAIALEEGFSVHHRKTRVMGQSVRQRIAGIVVNRTTNVPREDFDRLKATLTNCVRHGPESQNRDRHENFRAHLQGRVSFVEMISPQRGQRLRELFQQITWPT